MKANNALYGRRRKAVLEPLQKGGVVTAAVSGQTCDGGSAVLVVSEHALKKYNLTPRACIHHISVRADDPIWMLIAPISATKYAMQRAAMLLDDVDLVEIDDAFAPVVLAWLEETGNPHEKTNVNGGAIALGHPLGATGTEFVTAQVGTYQRPLWFANYV